jgi:hypothetical protein
MQKPWTLVLPALLGAVMLALAVPLWLSPPTSHTVDADSSDRLAKELRKSRRPDAQPNSLPNEWQFRIAAWPDGEVPLPAVFRAREQAAAIRARGHSGNRAIWQQAGPLNIGGRVTDIALDISDPDRVFVASAAGGVFRTTNGGADWQPVFQEEGALAIGDIVLDPQNPQRVWVGTGESNSSSYGFPGNGTVAQRRRR